jgi:uncharacterized protein involved in type VI secretion and phage assembly
MSLLDTLLAIDDRPAAPGRLFGLVIGLVTNNRDQDNLGRIKVRFPWLSDSEESYWARIAAPGGTYFLPEVDNEVLVAFEHGDPRFPYVLGVLANGKDQPVTTNSDGKNNLRMIKSRSGHIIKLNDEDGKETIEIVDKTGKNSVVIDSAKGTLTITTNKDITLSAAQGTITLDAQKIAVKSSDSTTIESKAGMDMKASGSLNLKGATVNIN